MHDYNNTLLPRVFAGVMGWTMEYGVFWTDPELCNDYIVPT